jgi:hypothetical protein
MVNNDPASDDAMSLSKDNRTLLFKDTPTQRNIAKDAESVKWWEVCELICTTCFLLIENSIGQCKFFPALSSIVLNVLPPWAPSVPYEQLFLDMIQPEVSTDQDSEVNVPSKQAAAEL